jgi:hypothetical protein
MGSVVLPQERKTNMKKPKLSPVEQQIVDANPEIYNDLVSGTYGVNGLEISVTGMDEAKKRSQGNRNVENALCWVISIRESRSR